MQKYKLLKSDISIEDNPLIQLYRIEALIDFADIKKGDLGGYIATEENLSHYGNCWVYDNAKVFGDAFVGGDAQIRDNAILYERAKVYDNAHVFDNAIIAGESEILDKAKVYGDAVICGNVTVLYTSQVCGKAQVYGDALIWDESVTKNNVQNLNLDTVPVTITDNCISIGSKVFSKKEWYNFNEKEIKEIKLTSVDLWTWWKKYKSVIFEIINIQGLGDHYE